MVNPGVPLPDANERDAGAAAVAIALPVRAAAEASVRAIIDTLRVKLQEQCHKLLRQRGHDNKSSSNFCGCYSYRSDSVVVFIIQREGLACDCGAARFVQHAPKAL